MYVLKDGDRIVYDGPGTPVLVAIAVDGGSEGAARLVAQANLAQRDEEMLDQIGERIARRNEA